MKDNNNDNGLDLSYDANYTSAKDEAMVELKKAQARNTFIIISIIVLVIGFLCFQKWQAEANLDYIDGNVLKIARTGSASVGTSWKNASFVGQLCFGSVFKMNSSFTDFGPDLATGYTVTDDGLTYVISMRDDLKWSDGTPLTVNDLKWSIETFVKVPSVNSTIINAFNYIEGVDEWVDGTADSISGLSISGNDLIVKLDLPFTSFAFVLTQFVVLPEHCLKDVAPEELLTSDFFKDVDWNVTSGMYKMDVINSDGDLELVPNEYYYGEAPNIERVIMYGDYQNMHIDHYATTNITEMISYRSMPGFEEHPVNVNFYRYFVFNTMADYDLPEMIEEVDADGNVTLVEVESEEPNVYPEEREVNEYMQDVRVRQAINHAIDIANITKEVYLGTAMLNYGGAVTIAEEVYEYNPEKAKELLVEAGYDFDRPFTIGYYHTDAYTTAFLTKVKENLEDIGLTVRVVKTNGSVALYDLREYDMFLKALSAFNTEDWYGEYLSTNTTLNKILGSDAFDDLVKQLYATTETEDYLNIIEELVELEQELVYKIPMLTLDDAVYINGNRVSVPEDMEFGNTRYRSDLRFDEWYIKKG